ncbi:spore germination protein [Neobacillus sp. DY30]|uniref:spore germination protein n=1 Tax=Neobacillus sp. DY30 TaxID=3047871 RepID=UPI0024BFF46A|nr:spore germination protein [Neobacillus sp. DY30]WHY01729.1 spore germination protein [Neobacillus sp. DY30]
MSFEKQNKGNIRETLDWLSEELKPSFDLVYKPLHIDEKHTELLYIKTVVDGAQLQQLVIKPFFELGNDRHVAAYLSSLPNLQEIKAKEQILLDLTKGSVIVAIRNQLLLLDIKKVNSDTVLESLIEPTIQGPQLSLSEDIVTNINLIRQRYHKSSLKIETMDIGEKTHLTLAILYDAEVVLDEVLENIKSKLNSIKPQTVQSTMELNRLLNDKKRSLMPIMMMTERTDRVVYNLAGGKVILLLDGSHTTVLAPAVFFDFMSSMDDKYGSYWITKFLKLLRYFGLFACLTLPGLYVAATSYNPEVFRVELALSVAGSRIGVPYPSFIEVLFLLVFMELLTEASIRLPKAVTGTATTVGGLILGQAATEAALASNIMIIIVGAVAISTFVIPINEMSFAIRVVRFILLAISSFAGLAGLLFGLIGLLMYLSQLNSFGEPYFKIYLQSKRTETERTST